MSGGGGPGQQMPQGGPMPAQGYQGTGASTGMDPSQIAQIMSGGGGATGGAGMPPPSYGPGGPGQDMNAWLARQPQGAGQPGVPPSTPMDPSQINNLMGGGMMNNIAMPYWGGGMGGVPPVGSGFGGFSGGQQPWQNQQVQMPGNYDQNTGLWTGAPQGPQQVQSAPPPMPRWQPPGGGWGQPPPGLLQPGQPAPPPTPAPQPQPPATPTPPPVQYPPLGGTGAPPAAPAKRAHPGHPGKAAKPARPAAPARPKAAAPRPAPRPAPKKRRA